MPIEVNKTLHQYIMRCCPPFLLDSTITNTKSFQKYYNLMLKQAQKWFAKKLDPFRLCPDTIMFWFFIRPYSAIGLAIRDLQNVQVFLRQQIEPNETVYLVFKVFELKPPFSLTLLATFGSLGLVIVDAAYRVFAAIEGQYKEKLKTIEQNIGDLSEEPSEPFEIEQEELKEHHRSLLSLLDPFNLTPRMSIYYPVYDHHTSIGFLTIDFRHVEFSIKQSLEPSDNILSLIRFLDLYSPFPLQIAVMLLSFGLFFNGAIYRLEKEKREEILRDVKRAFE